MIEKLWAGETIGHRIGRAALAPLEGLYRSAVAVRGGLFTHGILNVTKAPIDVISVGNLTVGGTGKTPVSAWLATRLAALGRRPAIVLRGYGDDEPIVHSRLNPGIDVIVEANRAKGISRAAASGADVAVLDDAFQHRAVDRDLDIVLISADGWTGRHHMLPAGPYRESPKGIRRASLVILTAKAASPELVEQARRWIRSTSPETPLVSLRLVQSALIRVVPPGEELPVASLDGRRVLAISAIGDPGAFFRQIEAAGATVVPLRFPDHHAFTGRDVRRATALARGIDMVVCTLKDAVKLAPIWPAGGVPLWYVSLSVEIESGEAVLDEMLRRLPGRRG
ncbi:MAG: tetraacyldisaccharide 4'-kinase [Gemmatimonadaceae bacterium]